MKCACFGVHSRWGEHSHITKWNVHKRKPHIDLEELALDITADLDWT